MGECEFRFEIESSVLKLVLKARTERATSGCNDAAGPAFLQSAGWSADSRDLRAPSGASTGLSTYTSSLEHKVSRGGLFGRAGHEVLLVEPV
jgi:hypothetical protein